MIKKNFLFSLFFVLSLTGFSQESETTKQNNNRLNLGLGMNIPMKPNFENYGIGMSISQRYEYLLWSHFSLVEGLAYNFISGKNVTEYYGNNYIQIQYENFNVVPLVVGMGYYFEENQKSFFILLKGGVAAYWGSDPAYPAVVVNGNEVVAAIPRNEFNGVYWFFTPSIGWQFDRLQISATYQGHVEQDASLNILNLSVSYRIL